MISIIIKPNEYHDSVALMVLSRQLGDTPGVTRASVMMGTPANISILRETGFDSPDLDGAAPGDLVIAVESDEDIHEAVADAATELLRAQASSAHSTHVATVRSFRRAHEKMPQATVALVSVPGVYAAGVARDMLREGLNVMIFSDNVSIADEKALKEQAVSQGLIVMGPDCGTALIDGVPLAFANTVRAGHVGIAGASGTGTQAVMCAIDEAGGGVSHALGLGGRDLSEDIGGISCRQALLALDADEETHVIVIVSKPPAQRVREEIVELCQRLATPVVALFLGEVPETPRVGNVHFVTTTAEAGRVAAELDRVVGRSRGGHAVRGIFTGGTLASEAAWVIARELGLHGSTDHSDGIMLDVEGHRVIDLGDDVYTAGRPHPMIDPSLRTPHIVEALRDSETAVVLLDVVLGFGSADDPAGAVVEALTEARESGARDVPVIAVLCGTMSDHQDFAAQKAQLEDAGVTVFTDNAAAAQCAATVAWSASHHAEPAEGSASIVAHPYVINIGLRSFGEDLAAHGEVVQWDWAPRAGGDSHLQELLDLLR